MLKEDVLAAQELTQEWAEQSRWAGIKRPYSSSEVVRLRSSLPIAYTLATAGAKKFWQLLHSENYTHTFGALTGAQAVNMVRAGLKALYVSGWQVAADANLSGHTYPDQSLYPANSVPMLVRRLNSALQRADQVERTNDSDSNHDWFVPLLADAEAGFGGPLHAFELMKGMIEAGAAAVHFEDQLASEKKCGHLGGKVLLPSAQFIRTLVAARLASDVCGVPTVILARTDAHAANLLTTDADPNDREFLTGERTVEGFYRIRCGVEAAIARALAYAPYADALWFETSSPDIEEAQVFAEAIHRRFPGKPLAYNCSPSFNWEKHLSPTEIASFQKDLGQLGYKFQFVTLAGWHLINYHSFELARHYQASGMSAYVDLQRQEFLREKQGYTATRHQQEVGTAYFDQVLMSITQGQASTGALKDSTEAVQFRGSIAVDSSPLTL